MNQAVNLGLNSYLAHYASGIHLAEVPEIVKRQAKLCILDTIGVSIAGIRDESIRPIVEAELERGARPDATVVGIGKKFSIEGAARVNAYAGDIFELNDLIAGHSSIGVVWGALPVAEALGSTGAELVEAVIVGTEVTSRVYSAYYPTMKPYTETGIVPPGFVNSYGAAAAVACLLNLDEQRMAEAMAIAGALAGWCPAEVIFGQGGTVKPMLFGATPAVAGIMGAQYALKGMTGPPFLLESQKGYYATAAKSFNKEVILDVDTWYLADPRRKLHACCGYIHSALTEVIALRKEGAPLLDAAEIMVGVPEYIIPGVSKINPPTTPNDARFHLQYMLSLAIYGVDAITPEHSLHFSTYWKDPAIQEIYKKIKVVAAPELQHYHQCKLTIVDHAGVTMLQWEGNRPKGSPQNPMSDKEVRAKFRNLVEFNLGLDKIQEYLLKIDRLEEEKDIGWLVNSFGYCCE